MCAASSFTPKISLQTQQNKRSADILCLQIYLCSNHSSRFLMFAIIIFDSETKQISKRIERIFVVCYGELNLVTLLRWNSYFFICLIWFQCIISTMNCTNIYKNHSYTEDYWCRFRWKKSTIFKSLAHIDVNVMHTSLN